jgi:phytoene synthase
MREGSKSFYAASRLLPVAVREPATILYAFCRLADDLVDDGVESEPVRVLTERMDLMAAGTPIDHPVDRSLAQVVAEHELPVEVFHLLFDGFEWDRTERRYRTVSDTVAYSVRVASTVGVIMTWIMGVRNPQTLERAADLGIAMQLTNIARDVGEDARRARVYLPDAWLEAEGIDRAEVLGLQASDPRVEAVVRRLLAHADTYYDRANLGIPDLPRNARVAIRAASLIYQDIGRVIARNGYDSVTRRAWTGKLRKAWLALRALGAWAWRRGGASCPSTPEVSPLVEPFRIGRVSS